MKHLHWISKKPLFIILLLIFTHTKAWGKDLPIVQKIQRPDNSWLHYYVLPALHPSTSHKADTLVVGLQGSSCVSVTKDPFLTEQLPAVFSRSDILLIEKYALHSKLKYTANETLDCPQKFLQYDTPQQRVDDALLILSKGMTKRSYENTFIIGGSEGATVGAMLAEQYEKTSAAILINLGGRFFQEDVEENMRRSIPKNQQKTEIDGFRQFAQKIKTQPYFEMEISGHGYSWWKEMLELDQQAILKSINVPTLVLQGQNDLNVSVNSFQSMKNSFQKNANSPIHFKMLEKLDHGLKDANGQYHGQYVLQKSLEWLNLHAQHSPVE